MCRAARMIGDRMRERSYRGATRVAEP